MTEEEKKIKQLLKIARMGINSSLLLILSGVLALVVSSLPEAPVKVPTTKQVAEIVVADEIDSTEIKDGIHTPSGLIADTGFTIVLTTCTRCHSIDVVKQNRATKEGWKHMITWMQKTQGLWDLGANEKPILEYLAKNYAPVNTGRRKNLENIVWYKLND